MTVASILLTHQSLTAIESDTTVKRSRGQEGGEEEETNLCEVDGQQENRARGTTNDNQTNKNVIDQVNYPTKEPCPHPYQPSYASCSHHQSYPLALTYQHYHPINPSTAIHIRRTMTTGSFSSTGIPLESSAMESIINSNPIAQIIPYMSKHFSLVVSVSLFFWPQKYS